MTTRRRTNPGARALLLNGTVGVGKTSVAAAVGDLLADAGVPHAVIDFDALRQAWPAPPGDRFNHGLLLRNLRAVAANYWEADATRLVLAGVIETREEREQCADAVGAALTVCRLRAVPHVVSHRLTGRHADEPGTLRWHLDRSCELDAILERADIDDFTIDTSARSLTETAAAVLHGADRGHV
ncbi:hypothetical protein [Streptomyces iconiensis]|uniref:Adenylylsulfate kinase n=1 Tax=Streptomyces iconiensis TaxID=1384038 RepID=A0ABT6ZZD8_9ACTN|nr:hypothetical protein [Streptomyces iconiensis]MDJ1134438.1 hypothetical protein [Streptomyces iconiensis]